MILQIVLYVHCNFIARKWSAGVASIVIHSSSKFIHALNESGRDLVQNAVDAVLKQLFVVIGQKSRKGSNGKFNLIHYAFGPGSKFNWLGESTRAKNL